MGLMSKLKNILFEEEEVEIPIIEKKEKPQPKPLPKEEPKSSFYDDLKEEKTNITPEISKKEEKIENISEHSLFNNEKTFNFPEFDEEEFSRISKPKPSPIREKEPPKREIPKKEEPVQPKKFRPSPIISPVYGILDKNYTPEEITSRPPKENNRLDVDSVRKKAFGLEEKVQLKSDEPIKQEIAENAIDNEENRILEEKLEKMRTIDELLNDSSDEIISLDELDNKTKGADEQKDTKETNEEEPPKKTSSKSNIEEDTLESDLFDLIDSMYENREDE